MNNQKTEQQILAHKIANKKWRDKNKEKLKDYYKQYYQEHKKELYEKRKIYIEKNKEKLKLSRHDYYMKHKDTMDENMKLYRKNNRAKVTKMILNRRKVVSDQLKAKGQLYTFLPKTERQNKMVKSLSAVMSIKEDDARNMLIEKDWNYKLLVSEYKENNNE